MMKGVIALDIGNVCVAIDRSQIWKKSGFTERPEAWLIAREFEFGKLTEEEFFQQETALLSPGNPCSFEALKAAFNSILTHNIPGMEDLVREMLGQGMEVAFFSDISVTHWHCFRRMFLPEIPLRGTFSFEVGCWKPEIAMFQDFESKFGKPLLYTDDRKELIDAALAYGWNAELFTSAQALKKTLAAL